MTTAIFVNAFCNFVNSTEEISTYIILYCIVLFIIKWETVMMGKFLLKEATPGGGHGTPPKLT